MSLPEPVGSGEDGRFTTEARRHGRDQINKGTFSGRKTRQGKSQTPVAWPTGRRETEFLKLGDKAVLGTGSEPSGRNESEREGSLET